jgi:hypothetical protein
MRKVVQINLLLVIILLLMSCKAHELINLDDTWVTEDLSFVITKYEDENDSFFVLTYIEGNHGTYTFELKNNKFKFFERERMGTPGNYTYVKTYLSESDLYFMMSYQVKTDTIQLLYVNIVTEPIVFNRIILEQE